MTVGVVRVRYEQRHDVQRESRYEDRRPHGDQDDRQLRLLLLGGRPRTAARRGVAPGRAMRFELLGLGHRRQLGRLRLRLRRHRLRRLRLLRHHLTHGLRDLLHLSHDLPALLQSALNGLDRLASSPAAKWDGARAPRPGHELARGIGRVHHVLHSLNRLTGQIADGRYHLRLAVDFLAFRFRLDIPRAVIRLGGHGALPTLPAELRAVFEKRPAFCAIRHATAHPSARPLRCRDSPSNPCT